MSKKKKRKWEPGEPIIDRSLEVFDDDGRQLVFAIAPFGASETREERLRRWELDGIYDPECPGCKTIPEHPTLTPFQPHHKALPSCRSGGRHHCTCPVCWG